ncbi:hypothetical protein TIFTF001_009027 [Ficus carica]|uniref:RNA methyltransferase n=1 Tax=Ficus carica TaxID=3494 RepID=A0AA87ZT76_FICCA|nr:hypothetical protein TIFTF001_009027 [Ficus carica]
MKLVAAAKIRRAQEAVVNGRPFAPFAEALVEVIYDINDRIQNDDIDFPLTTARPVKKRNFLLIFVLLILQSENPGQRPLPIRLLWVGKKRSRGVQLVFDEYIEKLKLYCGVGDVQIRSNPKNARDWRVQVEDEDNAVMNLIGSTDWVVLLDERGKDIGSEQMADLLGDAGNTGAAGLTFCIGGPYGHGQRLRERANLCIKLSSLVFNHQIALLVLVEQLYSSGFMRIMYASEVNHTIWPSVDLFLEPRTAQLKFLELRMSKV